MSLCKNIFCMSVIILVIDHSLQSPITPATETENVDLNVDLGCFANATCVNTVTSKVLKALSLRKSIDFGVFTIEPITNAKGKAEGRSFSKFWEYASSNAFRVPFGSYSLSLQKSEEHEKYLEVSISKTVEGRCALKKSYSFKKCQNSCLLQEEADMLRNKCNSLFPHSLLHLKSVGGCWL